MRLKSARRRPRSFVGTIEQLELRRVFSAGQLDSTFGIDGMVRTEFHSSATYGDTALATLVDSSNRVLAAGEGGMARFLPDGSIDKDFGFSGRVALPFYTRAMALQTDGKIVVAGGTKESNSVDLMVARYLPSGQLDTSFDSDGIVRVDVGGVEEFATAVLVEPSGRIVVAGRAQSSIAVARLLLSGQLDTAFSGDGWLVKQINLSDAAYGIARQANGQILVVGNSLVRKIDTVNNWDATNYDMTVLRINPNGTIDAAFGVGGMAYADFYASLYAHDTGTSIAVQADGKIVLSGTANTGPTEATGVVRLLPSGTLDPSFGVNGLVSVPIDSEVIGSQILPQADGKLLVANYRSVISLDSQGGLDTSFGVNGIFMVNGFVQGMAQQSNGAIVVAGRFLNGFGVKRLLANGSPDYSYSWDSVASALMGPSNDTAAHSALQPDGKIIVVGGSFRGFEVARYLPNGQLDNSFSSNGIFDIPFGEEFYEGLATGVVVQSDGRIVLAGWLRETNHINTTSRMGVVRLNIDGSLDTSFSGDGLFTSDLTGFAEANSVILQPDGKIVIAGAWNDSATMLRLNRDGSLDTQFSGDGVVTMSSPGSRISSLVLQPDGRILAAGSMRPSSTVSTRFTNILMVARFNTNGALDSSFGTNGKMLDLGSPQRTADDIALLPDGRFVVVGDTTFYRYRVENSQMAVSRYMPNGSLDPSFGVKLIDHVEPIPGSDFFSSSVRAWSNAVLWQPDGKIVVVGYSDRSMAVARLTEDGNIDSSFAGDGHAFFDQPNETVIATNVLRQSDGKLIISGYARGSTSGMLENDFFIVRLNSANLPDYSTSVRINAQGNVEIYDAWGRDDHLRFERTDTSIIVTDTTTDPRARFRVINLPGVTGDNTLQVTIPLSVVLATGKPLVVSGMDGDDQLIFATGFNAPATGFVFRGGNGVDRMDIPQSEVPVSWVLSTANSGSARPVGKVPLNFNSTEYLQGGLQSDSFRLVYQASSVLLRIAGGDAGSDSLDLRADADMSFTSTPGPGQEQRLLVDGAGGRQMTAMQGLEHVKLSGGASNNKINAHEFWGSATLYGGAGDDVILGSIAGESSIYGNDGNDRLYGWDWSDIIYGGRGDDLLFGGHSRDRLYGEDGMDVLVGEEHNDELYGGNGDDLLIGAFARILEYNATAAAREAVLATWQSADSYLTKIRKLTVDGVGPNNIYKLQRGTLTSDLHVDTYFGEAGLDFFFLNALNEIGLETGGLRDLAPDEQYRSIE